MPGTIENTLVQVFYVKTSLVGLALCTIFAPNFPKFTLLTLMPLSAVILWSVRNHCFTPGYTQICWNHPNLPLNSLRLAMDGDVIKEIKPSKRFSLGTQYLKIYFQTKQTLVGIVLEFPNSATRQQAMTPYGNTWPSLLNRFPDILKVLRHVGGSGAFLVAIK